MFSQLLKLVCLRVTQIPFGIVPVQLLLAHQFRCGQILASTWILKVHHLTDHRKETSKFLLSPLLTSTKLYMVAAYLIIPTSTTLKTVTATKNRQGFVLVALPEIKRRQVGNCPSIAGLYKKWFCSGGMIVQNRVDSGREFRRAVR